MDKYVGKRLDGRYEIERLIGEGGMANIYAAHDQVEDREVAIKIMKDEFLTNEEFSRRFRTESKAIAVLNHPNIVKIYDFSFGDNIQYIVMEQVMGITLKQYIEQQKRLSAKEAVHYTIQILRALQHAHSKGIMHRDIKPQNIMLMHDGTIKVMDFGVACFAREEGRLSDDMAVGSVHYISPEQARGEATDEKTDIYSVGVMLYEMLTGRLPFDDEQPLEVVRMKMSSDPTPPREIDPDIPQGLEEIILRAMQRNTASRYQSVSEMLRDLDTFRSDPNAVFHYQYFENEGSGTRIFRPVKEDEPEREPDEEEAEEEQKSKAIPVLAGIAAAFVVVAAIIIFLVAKSGPQSTEFEMPNLVGQSLSEMQEEYKDRLNFEVIATEFSDAYPAGVIYEQRTKAGRMVKNGTVAKVKVSKGPELIAIPDISGMSKADGEAELKRKGFNRYEFVERNDVTVASGYVISTYPAADEQCSKSETITVYLSKGPNVVATTVPNLVNCTEAEAKAKLEAANLVLGTVGEQYSDTVEKGKVVAQSVQAGAVVDERTTVKITLSAGPEAASSAVGKEATVSVSIPSWASGEYQFRVYLDGSYESSLSRTVNVSTVSSVSFKIPGGSGNVEVGIMVKPVSGSTESLYARFTVDTNTGDVTKTRPEIVSVFGSGGTASEDNTDEE